VKTPALDLWRKELAAGTRKKTNNDTLWRAACAEAAALEFASIPELAAAYLDDARRLILDAVRREGGVAA